jgi:hypothetical protein
MQQWRPLSKAEREEATLIIRVDLLHSPMEMAREVLVQLEEAKLLRRPMPSDEVRYRTEYTAFHELIDRSDPTSDRVHFSVLQRDARLDLAFLPIKSLGRFVKRSDRVHFILLTVRRRIGIINHFAKRSV